MSRYQWKPKPCKRTPTKAAFRHQAAAQHTADRLNRENKQSAAPMADQPLSPYECPTCGQWHLTRLAQPVASRHAP
jgi:ribosomal protein L37AE/L43A